MKKHAELVQKNFSYSAKTYDEIAGMQHSIADELLTRMHNVSGSSVVLDIGMGTGYLLKMLHLRYPDAQLFGCDYALGMLKEASKNGSAVKLLQTDAHALPFAGQSFDIAVSNLTYQWVGDLAQAFAEVRRVLKKGGAFYFTVFSENTLFELRRTILDFVSGAQTVASTASLPSSRLVEATLNSLGFSNIQIEHSRSRSYYKYLGELLIWLKQIGANRLWPQAFYRGLSSRGFLDTISREYEKRYTEGDRIFATFEVLFVSAINSSSL